MHTADRLMVAEGGPKVAMTRGILRAIAAQPKMPKRMDSPSSAILGLFFCLKKMDFC